jgi:hypothetical protein
MTLGFSRHMAPKSSTKKRDSLNGLGSLTAFQSHRDYSLTGCSPAEPISAYPDEINIIPIFKVEPKVYPHLLGFR